MSNPPPLKFTTSTSFRHRLICATLTGKPITITQIRSNSTQPGLLPHEVSFLRLLESLTNGSQIQISYTGTSISYKPGLIGHTPNPNSATSSSSKVIKHEIPAGCSRSVTYFLEPICLLAPFSKSPVSVVLSGAGCITSATKLDYSIDTLRTAILPLYASFSIERNIECRILKRSAAPGGGGEVHLVFGHQVRLPPTLHMRNPGRVKRIRGVAYCVGVSGGNNQRMISSLREVLNTFVNDIYIYSEVSTAPVQQEKEGKKGSPGFGIALVATTSTDVIYSADVASFAGAKVPQTPEEIGRNAALTLLMEIQKGGCVQSIGLRTVVGMMMMGAEDVGRIVLGKSVIDEGVVSEWRDWKKFVGGEVLVKEWKGSEGLAGGGMGGMKEGELLNVGVVGKGVGNVGRKIA